ncbi:MAG TPA: oxidoreductase [Actinomycetales bacterium]|nr:oxidoreductase [Actinomycetales bacterium]
MGLFSRLGRRPRSRPGSGDGRDQRELASTHLEDFVRTRSGVEAYVEPSTTVTPTTLLLIAKDGEWTRRPVPDPAKAGEFARRLSIPVYDVNLTGYPQRMRDYNARRKAEG